jgi:hypothetical protein
MKKNAAAILVIPLAFQLLAADGPRVSLISDTALPPPARHGVTKLKLALERQGAEVSPAASLQDAKGNAVVVAGVAGGAGEAAQILARHHLPSLLGPESFVVRKVESNGHTVLLLAGADARGLMYGLLDVAERVSWAKPPSPPFSEVRDTLEKPAVTDRALSIYTMHRAAFEERFFNEDYWVRYFDMLAQDRFNSFVIIFGYENGGYFAPAYPYFFNVPGFPEVRVVGLAPAQQQRNLRTLNRLIELAHERGLDFRVGLWDHIYRGGVQSGGVRDANPNQPKQGLVSGLTTTNLMAYSRAALAKCLKEVPALDGVQFRMHNESGLKPGAEMREFWKNSYQVIKDTRPDLRVDVRAKELPDELIDLGLDMGIKLRVCTKYWAEQLGLPFHPTHINRENQHDRRHGYADLLRYPQRYKMHWRLWNGGTTRVLLWGGPAFARRFAESTHLYDGDGFEVNEMLATKMEAQPHDQKPFALLRPDHQYYTYEFERYWHFYQLFGRLAYNPQTPPEVWQREFQRRFGPEAAPFLERGLHQASWILPRINASLFPYHRFPTTRGWVEKQRWEDLAAYAKIEGSDLQQFQSFAEAARDRLEGAESAKLSPARNRAWFLTAANEILEAVRQAEQRVGSHRNKEFESTVADLRILANLARYHAERIPAGLSYALFTRSQDGNMLEDAIRQERLAVAAWEKIVEAAGDLYAEDLMMGLRSAGLSGHWRDELAALRQDLAALETQRQQFRPQAASTPQIAHVPVRKLSPAEDLVIRATLWGSQPLRSVRVLLEKPGQAQVEFPMKPADALVFKATVPRASLVDGITYFIIAEDAAGRRARFPQGLTSVIPVCVTEDHEPPVLVHTPVSTAAPGKPLHLTAQVRDPSGVKWVRLLYRGVTQFEDFKTVAVRPTGRQDEFAAVVPGEDIVSRWDFMYLFEVMDQKGNGKIYPDLDRETPYIVVKLQR